MTFWEWLGFENPRDSPQPETPSPKEGLPQVTDNVRDSGQTFVFGRSNAGEQVDEKAAMQIPTVYACVRLLAESIAALPLMNSSSRFSKMSFTLSKGKLRFLAI